LGISTFTGSLRSEVNLIEAYTASLKGAAIVSSSQQITNYYKFAETASANIFYGNQSITGSLRVTGSLKVGDWFHGEGVANTAKLDIRTASDRGLKVTGGPSSDVIITAYRGASDDMVRAMRLEGSDINIYTGDGNANTGSYIGGFNTSGLAFLAGKGIDFSGTSNSSGTTSSELLNDYEEGTWTPILADDPSAGNLATGTFTAQYTKIGRLVTLQASCASITTTGMTGGNTLYIRGLPFTIAASQMSAGAANFYNVDIGNNNAVAWINAGAGSTFIRILKQSPTTNSALTIGNITTTTGEISFTIQYFV
jgi:hypothetical protein